MLFCEVVSILNYRFNNAKTFEHAIKHRQGWYMAGATGD